MILRRIFNNKAVSPVISTLLVIGIVTATIATIVVWGVPFIDESKHDAQFENSKNDLLFLEESINQLIQTGSGARKIAYISNFDEDSTVHVKNTSTKMIMWYSYNTSIMNFSVYGLDDGDNEFVVHKNSGSGSLDNISVYWLNDTCFLEGTKVLMADGGSKNIEDIRPGESVKSYDFENEKVVDSMVSFHHVHRPCEMGNYYLVINGDLCVTPNHKFYTNGGWVSAVNLKINDKLVCYKNQEICKIYSIEKVFEPEVSYDLTVKNTHNFYVLNKRNFVLVHNQPPYFPNGNSKWSIVKPTDSLFTGYPYNFTFDGAVNPDGSDEPIYYRYYWNGQTDGEWYSKNWTYNIFTRTISPSEEYKIKVETSNSSTGAGETKNESIEVSSVNYGENFPRDTIKLRSTLFSYHDPDYIHIDGPDANNNYTITTQKDIKGLIQINLYDSTLGNYYTLNGTLPFGKIWIFDLGLISHNMRYSDKAYTNIYENGAVYYYKDESNNPVLTDDLNLYENSDENVVGLRVVQIRTEDGYNLSGVGKGTFKINLQTKNNYVRDMTPNKPSAKRTNISNFYLRFYGENGVYWIDLLSTYFDFEMVDSNTVRYKHENVELILASVIMKADLVMK